MARFIVTGSYTPTAIKGMMSKPSDREAAAKAITKAAGGKLEAFHITTGPTDFSMTVSIDDVTSLMAGLMAAGGAGAVTNVQTIRAFSSAEFTEMQKKAGKFAASYKAPG